MNVLRSLLSSSLAGAALLGGGAALGLGCQSILGIHDVSLDGTGGSSSSSSHSASGTGGETASSTGATSGTGGQSTASFDFAITDVGVNVPYNGLNYVNLAITPSGGFNGAVDVTVQAPPGGLVTMPLTIPAGSTTGKLQVGAGTTLTLGKMFTLTLVATSGAISKTAAVPAVVTGKPGDLDDTFGAGGIVAGPSNSGWVDLHDIHEVPPHKIVVGGLTAGKLGGGNAIGMRLLADGTPDTSFAGTGLVSDSFCGCTKGEGGIYSVLREIDGTLLFVGWGNAGSGFTDDIFLFRYKDDGTFNTVQGDNGTEDINLGGGEQMGAAALAPNSNNVIVAGTKDSRFVVTRFADRQAFGAPDTSFASPTGFIEPAFGGTGSGANALTLDTMGRIVVTGFYSTGSDDDVVVVRLTPAGALDPAFGSGGIVKLARAGNQQGSAVIVQPDDTILVASSTDEGGMRQLLVQRLLSTGAPDPSFGDMGAALALLGPSSDAFGAPGALMARMLDGRLVVGGTGTLGTVNGPVFARFLPDGTPDPTFGAGGELAVFVGMYGALQAMSLESSGKLLISGSNGSVPGLSYIARIWN
jgi:uncharacterized delta-60 repeat protein